MSDTRLEKMKLIDCLKARHPNNPKEHDKTQLIASFSRFGFVAFPTIDEATGVMVAGHGRCEALEEMRSSGKKPPRGIDVDKNGEWMVPVVRGVRFENEQERDAYILADNQHVIAGGWNFEKMQDFLTSIADVGYDGIGFAQEELTSLMGDYDPPEPPPFDTTDVPPADPDSPPVSHDISVKRSFCCPSCGHKWQDEPKKKSKKS